MWGLLLHAFIVNSYKAELIVTVWQSLCHIFNVIIRVCVCMYKMLLIAWKYIFVQPMGPKGSLLGENDVSFC